MGGVGYNWKLSLPPPDQVFKFPFVAGLGDPAIFGSANPTPLQVLQTLSGQGGKDPWVSPELGENWIAAGLQFRSFELVLGRALAVVAFGRDLEIALLGVANMTLPQDATTNAYAYIELQLEVVLKPDDGVFSAIASLTPNSYLLTRECHLTGGFAFCLWFGGNDHAGDFVLTVGGYHPAFDRPEWYPTVPALGINWKVDDSLVIKGGAYFAITPTAGMVGGSLEVLYASGNLKAWLTAYVNVMVRWRPFYLTGGAGVSVGVSYRLDLGFTTTTLTIELGASLKLWGPPTGGIAHIDWTVISFTVAFGHDELGAGSKTLDWAGFEALLPHPSADDGHKAPPPAVLDLSINGGLTRTDSESGAWIVRADELRLTSTSAAPFTSAAFGSVAVPLPKDAKTKIAIRPMGVAEATSEHTITITGDESGPVDLAAWPAPEARTSKLPEALWGDPLHDDVQPAPKAKLVEGLATAVAFAAPSATVGAAVGPVDPASLVGPLGGGYQPLDAQRQAEPIAPPVHDAGAIKAIRDGIASDASKRAQTALVRALAGYGAAPPTNAPLEAVGEQAGVLFAQAPLLAAKETT
jgi:hypothetical protein